MNIDAISLRHAICKTYPQIGFGQNGTHTHRGNSAWFVCLAAEGGDRLTGSEEEIGEWRTGIGSQARWLRCWRCFEGEDGMEACMEKKWWLYRLFSFSQANRRGRCTMKNFLFFLDNLVWRKPISLFGCIERLSVLDIHLIFPIRSRVRYCSVTCYYAYWLNARELLCICKYTCHVS
jgi:hypothetical protein